MLVHKPGEYHNPDKGNASLRVLLPEPVKHESTPPSVPPPKKAVVFCPFPDQVCPMKWWVTEYCADHVDIFHMYAETGKDEQTEMQHKCQDSRNHSVL
jgi:hypothetical protein